MKSVATILREREQIKRADIPEELKKRFLQQKDAELAQIGQALPEPPAPPPKPTK